MLVILAAIAPLLLAQGCKERVVAPDPSESPAVDAAEPLAAQVTSPEPAQLTDTAGPPQLKTPSRPEKPPETFPKPLPAPKARLQAPRYPATRTLSPLTPAVAQRVRAIARKNPSLRDDVFMKVGASGSASPHLLRCLAGADVVLGGFSALESTLTALRASRAAGTSPLLRKSLAAKPGMNAGWAITGSPSPVEQEMRAISPRIAFVHYGTNDMHLAQNYAAALQSFGRNLVRLVDGLIGAGVVPTLGTLPPRLDNANADLWVPTYNQLVRAVAQSRRIPLLDMHTAMLALPNQGRAADLLHANVLRDGRRARPCVFTDRGLRFAYNVRNYLSLRVLDQVRKLVQGRAYDEEPEATPLAGVGSSGEPFVVDSLPFADLRDLRMSPHLDLDGHRCPGTKAARRTGPEYVYNLTLKKKTHLRIVAANLPNRGGTSSPVEGSKPAANTEVELVLMPDNGAGCLAFGRQRLEGSLPAGDYRIAVETTMRAGEPLWGEFAVSMVACEATDGACEASLLGPR